MRSLFDPTANSYSHICLRKALYGKALHPNQTRYFIYKLIRKIYIPAALLDRYFTPEASLCS